MSASCRAIRVAELKLESGRVMIVRLIDISMSGTAISADEKDKLPIGTSVTLGHTAGTVVRHFQGGMAVEFLLSLSPDRFDENLVL